MQKYHPMILTQISSSYLGQNSKYPAKYFGKNLFTMCSYIKLEWGIEEYSRRVLMKVISHVYINTFHYDYFIFFSSVFLSFFSLIFFPRKERKRNMHISILAILKIPVNQIKWMSGIIDLLQPKLEILKSKVKICLLVFRN